MTKRRVFTPEELLIIQRDYPNRLTREIAQEIGATEKQVYDCAYKKFGLKKSQEFLKTDLSGRITKTSTMGVKYRFKKSHVPHNKGKKMQHTPEAKAAMAPSQFKKGQQPHNAYPDGTEVIFTDHKQGRQYWKLKVPGINKLVFKHVFIYLQHYGEIPTGHILRFKDGNTLNCVIENLEAITRQENMKRNTIARYPLELRSVMHLHKKLTAKIQQHEKQD